MPTHDADKTSTAAVDQNEDGPAVVRHTGPLFHQSARLLITTTAIDPGLDRVLTHRE